MLHQDDAQIGGSGSAARREAPTAQAEDRRAPRARRTRPRRGDTRDVRPRGESPTRRRRAGRRQHGARETQGRGGAARTRRPSQRPRPPRRSRGPPGPGAPASPATRGECPRRRPAKSADARTKAPRSAQLWKCRPRRRRSASAASRPRRREAVASDSHGPPAHPAQRDRGGRSEPTTRWARRRRASGPRRRPRAKSPSAAAQRRIVAHMGPPRTRSLASRNDRALRPPRATPAAQTATIGGGIARRPADHVWSGSPARTRASPEGDVEHFVRPLAAGHPHLHLVADSACR